MSCLGASAHLDAQEHRRVFAPSRPGPADRTIRQPATERRAEVPPTPHVTPAPEPVDRAASPFAADPSTYAPQYQPSQRWIRFPFGFNSVSHRPAVWYAGYPIASYPGYPVSTYLPTDTELRSAYPQRDSRADAPTTGTLYLEVEPATARVYVDSIEVGSVEDFRAGLTLTGGPHRIELRAPGYEKTSFDVDIGALHTATFRGRLSLVEKPAVELLSSPSLDTFYVISGCYAGNRPPREANLRSGCDVTRMRSFTPR